jgi:hypothetical protein
MASLIVLERRRQLSTTIRHLLRFKENCGVKQPIAKTIVDHSPRLSFGIDRARITAQRTGKKEKRFNFPPRKTLTLQFQDLVRTAGLEPAWEVTPEGF